MTGFLKRFLCVLLIGAGGQSVLSFSIWGTPEGYQLSVLGYERRMETDYPGGSGLFSFTTEFPFFPHNLGEEYRWSVPVLYYTYDPSFWDYFGAKGVEQVDSAFSILNALTNVSSYSEDLSEEFPEDEARFNYTAQAFHLFDLKSAALEMLVTRMGLADPERWVWAIHNRFPLPGGCPNFLHDIDMRNFDPVSLAPTRYINGHFFTYLLNQHCPPDVRGDRVDAEEFKVDPEGLSQTAVASPKITVPRVINYGMFHVGLTRDDMGGLRYLYRTNNMNVEMAPPEAILFGTNFNTSQLLFTSNLTLLVNQALTNSAAQLQALYPNLVIGSTTEIFTNVVSTNVFFFFTNYPWAPAGTVVLAFQTNVVTNVTTWFSHTFDNVVTNTYYTRGFITVLETSVGPRPFGSPSQLYTNVTARTILTNFISGDYYILPTNSDCGVFIISTQLTSVINLTNTPVAATNAAGATNVNGQSFAQELVFLFTNRVFVIHPVPCVTNSVALRQGLEKISFVRRDFDSLLNRFFHPITNFYTMIAITNNQPFVQRFMRIVTRPDILITATDLANSPHDIETVDHSGAAAPFINNSNAIPGLAGPGTLQGPVTLSFNKVGPYYLNVTPFFITEQQSFLSYIWASFDGSTNAPVIYPTNTSIYELEAQVVIQVSPPFLSAGSRGAFYVANFSASGSVQLPYLWSLTPGSQPLPPGLSLSADGELSGTPTLAGTYNFSIRATDTAARFVDTGYVLLINP